MGSAVNNRHVKSTTGLFLVVLAIVLMIVASCGGSDDEPTVSGAAADDTSPDEQQEAATEAADTGPAATTDDATSGDGATATEAAPTEVADETTGGSETEAAVEQPADHPVFSEDVLPVLEDACASCHNAGQAGSTELVLATAADAVEAAEDIKLVTQGRVMPPWPASDLSVEFTGDHSLSNEQIAAVAAWADSSAPLDVAADTPIASSQPPSYIEDPDIVMTSAKGPYTGSPENKDDYRCLIYEPGNTDLEWILASHFEPDQTEVVHHGIITLASKELRGQAEFLNNAEPGPGWTCYGGTGLNTRDGGYEFGVGGWAPGGQPARQPEGYAIPLRPGDFFVVQIHYHFEDEAPADLSRYVLDLASDEEVTAQGGSFKSLRGSLYLGPAEIPCYEGDTHPLCDRDAALQRVKDVYGEFTGSFADGFLRQCGSTPEDYAHMTDGDASSTCDLNVRNPGRIVSVTGHMHELGKSIRLTLNPDTPEEQILLDIPDWDFEWQLGYRPVDDIIIDRDDIIRVDCAWNRERAPYEAVGYILWADGTGDEMCYSSITTAPLT